MDVEAREKRKKGKERGLKRNYPSSIFLNVTYGQRKMKKELNFVWKMTKKRIFFKPFERVDCG